MARAMTVRDNWKQDKNCIEHLVKDHCFLEKYMAAKRSKPGRKQCPFPFFASVGRRGYVLT